MITNVPDEQAQPIDNGGIPEETFESFAETMPESATGFLDDAIAPPSASSSQADANDGTTLLEAAASSQTSERKRVNVTKKVRRAMNRLKTKTANVPIMWFHAQAKEHPEWELDADERDMLKDAVETVFEVLDIEIEIEPLSWTLTSVWWVISYPILAFVFLFLTKKSLTMDKEQPENETMQ